MRWGRGDGLWGVCFPIELLRVILETVSGNPGLASAEFIVYASAAYNAYGVYFGDQGEGVFLIFLQALSLTRSWIRRLRPIPTTRRRLGLS